MRSISALALIVGIVCSAFPAAAQDAVRPVVDLRGTLTRGERISVELMDGRTVSGVVGDSWTLGFMIERPPATAAFVRYLEVIALRDPDTGAVIEKALPQRQNQKTPRWVVATLVTVGVVAAIAIATHGLFPGCLFERCLR
jgi:hypothetical protein